MTDTKRVEFECWSLLRPTGKLIAGADGKVWLSTIQSIAEGEAKFHSSVDHTRVEAVRVRVTVTIID